MKLKLELTEWQAELLRRAINVYQPENASLHDKDLTHTRLVLANAIIDAMDTQPPDNSWKGARVSTGRFRSGADWHCDHAAGDVEYCDSNRGHSRLGPQD